jgi:hypothetical protein
MNNFKAYLPLCWFRGYVLLLPTTQRFFKQNLFFYFAVIFFIQFNMSDDIDAIFEVILETLLTLGFVGGILLLNKSHDSFAQITTAILFCQNVISTFLLPVMFWATTSKEAFGYLLLSGFLFWAVLLIARIFKQVLDINNAAALVVSLAYFLIVYGGAYGIDSLVMG